MLIETDAHRRDAERAAVGVFALRPAHSVDRRGLEIEAAERGIVGVEDGLVPPGLRQRQAVVLPQDRAEIAHGDELFALAADAAEGDDGIVAVGDHNALTFSMTYAYSENFILPLSHDEVVHGKCSLIGRMPGDWWRQFAGLRTLAFYQMTHPGAKLNFMGNEIGQFIEWRYYESIQWFLTEEYETHKHHQAFIKALNHLYTAEPALYERGYTDDGFTWIDADNSKQSIVSFVRQGEDVDDDLVILINFDPASYESFRVGVPREGDWEVIFDSDRPEFGGSGYAGEEPYTCSSEPYPWNGQMDSIEIKVPGLAGVVIINKGSRTSRIYLHIIQGPLIYPVPECYAHDLPFFRFHHLEELRRPLLVCTIMQLSFQLPDLSHPVMDIQV